MAEMQKKNWIGWSGTDADELLIGWRGIDIEVDMPKEVSLKLPKITTPMILDYSYTKLPEINGNGWCLSILLGDLLSDSEIKQLRRLSAKSIKELFNQLRTRYGLQIPTEAEKNTNVVSLFTKDKLINVIPLFEIKRAQEKEKIRKVFTDDIHMAVILNPLSLPSTFVEWAKAVLQATHKMPHPKVVAGDVFVCGRLSEKWVGMRIVKE